MKTLMTSLVIFLGLGSEMALGAACGKAQSDISVAGLGIDFTAEGASVECQYTKSDGKLSGVFTVKIKDFKTGMDLRDEHMHEALNAKENPEMKFALTAWPIKSGAVDGDLTLNGKTKKVTGWKASVDGSKVVVTGDIDYTEFGLEQAKYKKAGVVLATVPKQVSVKVEVNI